MKPNAFRLCRQVERLEWLTLLSTLELLSTLRYLPISGYHIEDTLIRESFQRTGGRISHAALLTEGRAFQGQSKLMSTWIRFLFPQLACLFANLCIIFFWLSCRRLDHSTSAVNGHSQSVLFEKSVISSCTS